jgi:Domain of unknown function (DUF4124)
MFDRRMTAKVLGISFLLTLSAPLAAEVYKWVDERGTVNYSPVPPPDQGAEEISIGVTPGAPPAGTAGADAPAPADDQAADAEPPTDAPAGAAAPDEKQLAEQKAISEQVCTELREALSKLQTYARLYERDAAGNITWLTEAQRQQRITDAEAQMKQFCQ